jgi:hypothetical protein
VFVVPELPADGRNEKLRADSGLPVSDTGRKKGEPMPQADLLVEPAILRALAGLLGDDSLPAKLELGVPLADDTEDALTGGNSPLSSMDGSRDMATADDLVPMGECDEPVLGRGLTLNPASMGSGRKGGDTCTFPLDDEGTTRG